MYLIIFFSCLTILAHHFTLLELRRRDWCTIFANIKFHCKGTWLWWIFRYMLIYTSYLYILELVYVLSLVKQSNSPSTLPPFIFCRRGMKGCFTSFLLIMLRNCSQLSTLQQLVRLARNTGAFSGVLRVFTSVWKRSRALILHYEFFLLWEIG